MAVSDRIEVMLSCPGSMGNLTVIVATAGQAQYGIGHPANVGDCRLFLGGLDGDGNPVEPQNDVVLYPGDSRHWYYPPNGSVQIVAVCASDCHGQAILEYDMPVC